MFGFRLSNCGFVFEFCHRKRLLSETLQLSRDRTEEHSVALFELLATRFVG